jgi:hypothetical protein
MDFSELKKEMKGLIFEEIRSDLDNYFEAVILHKDSACLASTLGKFFGTPVFPSETVLAATIQEAIKSFGGINRGQTLYFWNEDKKVIFALLWPWQDKAHTTLKLVYKSAVGV